MSATGPDLRPGDMVPGTKYRVVKQIGAGGMGVVYQVVKPPEIQGVLKLMSTELTEHEEFRTRFLDEVRVLAGIDHPNIVKVFDYDKLPDGTPFYVMELLHGRTVRDVLATMGTMPPRVAFEVTRQLCEALHCAHTHDIPVIHRDIKPENIFLHAPRHGEPVVKLIDFGVVAIADRQHDGAFVGTWKYAAPEQIRGERATPATDLYAVGLVLYEMLCGIGPFEHLDSGSLVSQAHLREIPAPVSKFAPWVPPSIVELISVALAKDPRQRPRSAYMFAERLFELEWANDGKDPNDRTSEGPLSRILSTVGGVKPSSKNMVAAEPAKDRLAGNVPLIGVPHDARHGGPTLKGVGGTHEATSPGEDALLAGLIARPDVQPRSKKARESDRDLGRDSRDSDDDKIVIRPGQGAMVEIGQTPRMPQAVARAMASPQAHPNGAQTMDAPASAPKLGIASGAIGASADTDQFSDRTTRKLNGEIAASSRSVDTDTFGSHESDARRAPKRARLALPIALVLSVVVLSISFMAYRARTPAGTQARMPSLDPPVGTSPVASGLLTTAEPTAPVVAAPPPTVAQAVPAVPSASSASTAKTSGNTKPGRPGAAKTPPPQGAPVAATPTNTAAPPAKAAPPPTAKPKDDSFIHGGF